MLCPVPYFKIDIVFFLPLCPLPLPNHGGSKISLLPIRGRVIYPWAQVPQEWRNPISGQVPEDQRNGYLSRLQLSYDSVGLQLECSFGITSSNSPLFSSQLESQPLRQEFPLISLLLTKQYNIFLPSKTLSSTLDWHWGQELSFWQDHQDRIIFLKKEYELTNDEWVKWVCNQVVILNKINPRILQFHCWILSNTQMRTNSFSFKLFRIMEEAGIHTNSSYKVSIIMISIPDSVQQKEKTIGRPS